MASSLLSLDPGDPNDPSHTLPSFTFVIYQLSLLLTSLGSTATDTFARQQLLAAFSNVLCASLQYRQHTPTSFPSSPAVQAAPASPATSPVIEPPCPPPSSPPPAPVSTSPVPPLFGIRLLTPVEPLTAPIRPRRSSRSRKRRVRSCPSSPVPDAKRPSPVAAADQTVEPAIITAITTPTVSHVSPNPFSPLAADADGDEDNIAEQASSDDLLAPQPLTVSAVVSSVPEPVPTVPSPSPSAQHDAMTEFTTPIREAGPPQRFFQQLATRNEAQRSHFEKHYRPSSTMCGCDLFPAYSSKQLCDAKLPPECDRICLLCVYSLCSSLGEAALNTLYGWVPVVDDEICTYYGSLYSDREIADITAALPQRVVKSHNARTALCARQLSDRLGAAESRV